MEGAAQPEHAAPPRSGPSSGPSSGLLSGLLSGPVSGPSASWPPAPPPPHQHRLLLGPSHDPQSPPSLSPPWSPPSLDPTATALPAHPAHPAHPALPATALHIENPPPLRHHHNRAPSEIDDPRGYLPPMPPNRKWKRLCMCRIRYDAFPQFFDEAMPDVLEGKQSNFVFTQRMRAVNDILSRQRTIKDLTHVHRSAATTVILVAAVLVLRFAFSEAASSSAVFYVCVLAAFLVWMFVYVQAGIEPRYQAAIRRLCKEWTAEDLHLHLGYVSLRGSEPRHGKATGFCEAVARVFLPMETEWYIGVYESVAIFPVAQYGTQRDGTGWTAATADTCTARVLPLYAPAWDATPAPEYMNRRQQQEGRLIDSNNIITPMHQQTETDANDTTVAEDGDGEGCAAGRDDDDGDVSLSEALDMPPYKAEYEPENHDEE
ncbi:hypothetical protein HDU84_004562 [Entophlyctis sp. JEL0112]|nr:hypothetical protein HDU84_004562 [Entophlyctis sp. JEL0112]